MIKRFDLLALANEADDLAYKHQVMATNFRRLTAYIYGGSIAADTSCLDDAMILFCKHKPELERLLRKHSQSAQAIHQSKPPEKE